MRLRSEGTEVFGPAHAQIRWPGIVRLLLPEDYDPVDEDSEFEPGTVVCIEAHRLGEREIMLAVAPWTERRCAGS